MATKICGECAYHDQAITNWSTGFGADGKEVRFAVAHRHGGHAMHPNGNCVCPAGKWKGVVVGWYGSCPSWAKREPEPVAA